MANPILVSIWLLKIRLRTVTALSGPKLLEPVMCVDVALPEEYTGTVAGDLTRRRGMITALERKPAVQSIQAAVPLSELFGYITVLRTLTAGRASASLTFEQYKLVPDHTSRKIVAG
jgi:elongation factor G